MLFNSSWEKQPQLSGDGKSFPLSHGQQAMWFLYQIAPQSVAYNIYTTVRIGSELDLGAWHRAWEHIVERHQALRTTYTERDGQPVQVVHPYQEVDIKVTDASSWSDDYLNKQILAEAECPYNLETGPVLRVHLFTRSEQEHIQLLAMHHIAGDMWSFDILLSELRVLYAAEVKTLPPSSIDVVENSDVSNSQRDNILPLPMLSYTDYVRWQTEMLASSSCEQLSAYWLKQLAGELPLLDLPVDKPRPREQTYRGASHIVELDEELLLLLRELEKAEGVNLYTILLAAFFVQLYRFSGQEDILVGSPMAGRSGREEFKEIVGYFTNPVVCCANLSGNPTFKEFLAQVSGTVSEAREYQDYPFPLLVKQLSPDPTPTRHPLFQVSLTWQKPRWYDQAQKSPLEQEKALLVMEPYLIEGHQRGAAFDLDLAIVEAGSSLQLCWQYNTDLFDASTVHRMADSYQTLLEGILTNPEERVSALPLLTQAERHQLLVEWNNTEVEYPNDKCIHQLFEEQVERSPDAIAVVFEEEHLTYRELNQRANCLAYHLKTLGVGPEVLVGICVERSLYMVVGLLGILKAGGAYVPLDPAYPSERLAFMLEDSCVPVLLTQAQQLEKLPPHSACVVCLDSDWSEIDRHSSENPTSEVASDTLAYVIYTSGSTGKPKGVAVPHRAVNRLVINTNYINLEPLDVVAQVSNCSFDAATFEIWGALLNGARLVVITKDVALSPQDFAAQLHSQGITVLFLTTALFNQIASVVPSAFHSVQHLLFGGEAVDPRLVKQVLKNSPPQLLLHVYGPTESTTFTSWYLIQDVPEGATTIPIGRPIANTQVYLLDEKLQPVPIGVPGELYIGGDGLARGYLNRPDLTDEKFIPNPWSNQLGSRLYKTGDKARYLSDGNIEFLGRIDNQVKIRGFRIELGEIEAALLQHPKVRDAVVIVREDTYGDKRLAAYIVSQSQISKAPAIPGDSYAEHISHWQTLYEKTDSQTPTHQNQNFNINQPLQSKVAQKLIPLLRSFLQEKLPDYMVPNAFMLLSTLPLTPNGKIDRHSLPVPDLTRLNLQENLVAPSTHVEKVLAQIWSQVLGIKQVGIYDKFLELGGHSLLAIQIVSRLRDILKVDLPVDSLFGSPTIAELQERIEGEYALKPFKQAPPIPRVSRNQNLPLSWGQEQLWFLAQLEPDTPVYNEPCTIRFPGAININALEKALNEIIKRHESLRTRFLTVDGQPVQVIAPPATFNLTVVDLRQLPQQEREAEALRLATTDAKQLFDLTTGPLWRATLMQLADVDYRLFLTFHHIVIDGVSIYNVFLKELATLYEAFSLGKPSLRHATLTSLAELPVQYADFAVWQRQWLTEEILARQLNYWKQQLADLPVLQLPYDRLRPEFPTFRGARQCLALSFDLTSALKVLSQQSGVTLYMTLLAAFKTLLYRYTGSSDIVVGTVSAGRNRPEIEETIGYFLKTLVVRTELSGNPSFRKLLSKVREVTLEAYAHEELPFQELVKTLQPERNLSQNPLFQVAFVLEPPMPSLNSGWTMSQLDIQTDTAKFDLTLELDERPEGIVGRFKYNTDLFEAATISRMIEHFKTMLAGIVANSIARVSQLPLLTERERHQLLVKWNNTTKEYPQDKCIHQLFEEQVELTPDAIAVIFEDKQLTYRELNQQANKIAHYLRTLGVRPEVLVGICVERSLEMVVSLLGILKVGGAYLPLDPALPQESLVFRLIDAQVPILLTQKGLLKREDAQVQTVLYLDADWELIAQESSANPNSEVIPENLAYVLYTSGSTGQPKGVAIEHRQILNYLHAILDKLQLPTGASFATVSTFAADLGNTAIFPALCTGGCLHIVSQELSIDPKALAEYFVRHPIDCLKITPAHLASLLASASDSILPRQCLVLGGEAASWDLIEKIRQYAPNSRILNHYGPTETTVGVLTYPVLNKPASHNSKTVPIGRPIANTQVYILDRHQQTVPIGVPGELHIGGASLARGYLNRPDLTDEKFINLFSDNTNTRLYKTGDLVRYLSDGNIEFLGRLDRQVKIRGFRIELSEVETAIASHPAVRETVVVAREDIPDHKYLAAYIVSNQKEALTSSTLRNFLKEKLPSYMVPGAFVMLNALPLTPNGKVDRRALPPPEPVMRSLSLEMPQTKVEKLIADVWQKILLLEEVGLDDNFFDLGGHSLLLIKVWQKLQIISSKEISVVEMFKHPTVRALGQLLSEQKSRTPDDAPKSKAELAELRRSSQGSVNQQRNIRQQYRSQKKQ